MPSVDARSPIDDFRPPWPSFAAFFANRGPQDRYLLELDRERGSRRAWDAPGWRRRVGATVAWLAQRGVGPGGCVASLAGNSADALVLAYAAWVAGACYVPLNPHDSAERQAFILRDAGADLLVATEAYADRARRIASGIHCVTTAALPADGAPPPETGPSLDAPALRVYTSGTTGEPKGVVLTAASLLTDCDALHSELGWGPTTRVLTVLPIHHVNALIISSLLPWYSGASTVLCDRFRSERFWSDAAAEGATTASLVPTLLEFVLGTAGDAPAGVGEVLCGAGPLLVETALGFEERFGVAVRHLYGLSETTCVSSMVPRLDAVERRRWHRDLGFPAIGPALPHVEMAVVDPAGTPMPSGVRGELVIRGAAVMHGYAGRADATADALRDGWFHSGDEGFWEPGADGRPWFFITGRMKELIIRGGVNISPFEIDEVLRSHPAVVHALAVPFDNRFYGDEIAAYVVAESPVTEPELLAHCARYLDFARQPKLVVFGDDVPYTPTGKAKRLELKERLAPQLATHRDTQFRAPAPAAHPPIRT